MFKISYKLILGLGFVFVLNACVQPEVRPSGDDNKNTWGEEGNINDVDISDLDGNLTESEMIITEEGGRQVMERVPFSTSEYNSLARYGKGTIKGSIYVNGIYGDKVLGVNTRLYLNPVTSYSQQWYEESYLGGYKMEKADKRLFNYLKFTASNSEGDFAFYGVPSGSYYLIGTVKCSTQCGYETEKNIRIATRVSISGNQIIEQDLIRVEN